MFFPLRLEAVAVVSLVVVDCMEMFVKNGSLKVLRANGSAWDVIWTRNLAVLGKPQKENVLKKVSQMPKQEFLMFLNPPCETLWGKSQITSWDDCFHKMGVHWFMYPHSKVPKCLNVLHQQYDVHKWIWSFICLNCTPDTVFRLLFVYGALNVCCTNYKLIDLTMKLFLECLWLACYHVDICIMKVQAFKEQLQLRGPYQNCGSFHL